jgi:hypothetical protein
VHRDEMDWDAVTELPRAQEDNLEKLAEFYSRGRRNSRAKRRISPADSCRKTFAVIGGVSLGTKLEDAGEGAGMVRWTV